VGPARDDAARMGQVKGSWYLQNHRSALHHPADYLELDGPTVIHQHGDIRPPVHALGKPHRMLEDFRRVSLSLLRSKMASSP